MSAVVAEQAEASRIHALQIRQPRLLVVRLQKMILAIMAVQAEILTVRATETEPPVPTAATPILGLARIALPGFLRNQRIRKGAVMIHQLLYRLMLLIPSL